MTHSANLAVTTNAQPLALADIPDLAIETFADTLAESMADGRSTLSALFGVPNSAQRLRIYAVTSQTATGKLSLFATEVGDRYPALTPRITQAHWFERELAEQWGVVPEGHPWLKPLRFHRSYRNGQDAWGRTEDQPILPGVLPENADYFKVRGEEIHEVAEGPIHAGVIEPGHFRFQCHGERVFTLEIEFGYQHRGIERSLIGGPDKRTLHTMETLSGDATIGHTTAYCQALEGLADQEPPIRAQAIRALALELERLPNHTGDLGALAGDIGYLPTLSYCGRIRGDFLNTTALLCGNRYGRNLVRPGGVAYDLDENLEQQVADRVATAYRDVTGAIKLLWASTSVLARLENIGTVPLATATELGMVGMAARASGIDRDVRRDFPSGYFRFVQLPVAYWHTGDAFARGYIRHLEIGRSCRYLMDQIHQLPGGDHRCDLRPRRGNQIVASLVEGWRGEICHVAITDNDGQFAHYKIIDPSFHNWCGLAMALRDQEISDFPLNNKSFNLSYCGHDL